MAAVSINTGIPRPDKSAFDVPPDQLKPLAMARRRWAEIDLPCDCRLMKQVYDEAPVFAEAMGYESGDQFMTDYLSLDLDLVHRVIGWLEQEQPTEASPLQLALGTHGGDRRSEEARQARGDQADNLSLKHGTQAAYLKARLERDCPEVAAALDRGEHRSARAAAIAAGIIKPVPTVRLVHDPPKVAAAIAKHFNRAEIEALCQALLSIPTNEQ
jgi:hypothetical protein